MDKTPPTYSDSPSKAFQNYAYNYDPQHQSQPNYPVQPTTTIPYPSAPPHFNNAGTSGNSSNFLDAGSEKVNPAYIQDVNYDYGNNGNYNFQSVSLDSTTPITTPPQPASFIPVTMNSWNSGGAGYAGLNSHTSYMPAGNHVNPNEDLFVHLKFSEKSIANGFVRKVFGLLVLQILVTAGIIAFMVFNKTVQDWLEKNLAFFAASLVISLILTVTIHCSESMRKKSPQNIIMLGLLTISYGITAGAISAWLGTEAVIYAAGFVLSICASLVLFSFQTKWRFRKTSAFIVITLLYLVIGSVLAILFFAVDVLDKDEQLLSMSLAFFGSYFLSFLLIWTLSNILNGTCNTYRLSPEEYITATLILYTEILLIFLIVAYAYAGGKGGGNNCGGGGGACCTGVGHGGYFGGYHGWWCCWGTTAVAMDEQARRQEEDRRANGVYVQTDTSVNPGS